MHHSRTGWKHFVVALLASCASLAVACGGAQVADDQAAVAPAPSGAAQAAKAQGEVESALTNNGGCSTFGERVVDYFAFKTCITSCMAEYHDSVACRRGCCEEATGSVCCYLP
jgi:hypothetical protein